jgi:Na+/H+ antiporter NhaC
MHLRNTLSSLLLIFVTHCAFAQDSPLASAEQGPQNQIKLTSLDVSLRQDPSAALVIHYNTDGIATVSINGEEHEILISGGQGVFPIETDATGSLYMLQSNGHNGLYHVANRNGDYRFRNIPLWMSILPPLIAIFLALLFKEVLVSLFVGIWTGAFIAGGLRFESPFYLFQSFLNTLQKYVIEALADSGHLAVIVFSLLIGAMVAIISKNGGMAGVVQGLSRYATSGRRSQAVTWLLGVAIFFDDYANTLIVGNTMRAITDKFNVSREKLAYIVDSTAAPVAAVAFITTWIGAELGYIDSGMAGLDDFPFQMTPYAIFVSSLKYSFYPILTLSFILILIYLKKDYGPMLKAETRAYKTGSAVGGRTEDEDEPDMEDLSPVKDAPLRWYNAFIPVSLVVLMTIFGLLETGLDATFQNLLDGGFSPRSATWAEVWPLIGNLLGDPDSGFFIKLGAVIGNADSYTALLWASLTGVAAAILLTIGQRIIGLFDTMFYFGVGIKTMIPAILILTLAWALAITTQELYTATYLTSMLSGNVSPYLMPAITFVLAASIAFSTGSSWSTMAILYPIAIPTTWAVCVAQGLDPEISLEIMLNVVATVLAASVLGDHCSPISDTTILSSLASDCNHIDHVRTQLPYALTVGGVSLAAGTISTLLGGGWGISAIIGVVSLVLLWGIVFKFGKNAIEVSE